MRVSTIALLWASVAAFAAYWMTFFAYLPGAAWDPCYVAFERAFPPADAVLASSAVVTAEALRRRRAAAVAWGLFSAGQFCFLGLLDISFTLQNGGYDLTVPMLIELAANVFCLGFAAWLGVGLWRYRRSIGLAT